MIDDVINAEFSHIPFIVSTIRQVDLEECWDLGRITARDALEISLRNSVHSRTWILNGYPAAMGGISRHDIVWLLGTEIIDKYPRRFLVRAYAEFEKVKKEYDFLYNYIWSGNKRYLNWIRWMGFDVTSSQWMNNKLFYRFEWRKQ